MRRLYQLLGLRTLQTRQGDLQLDLDAEAGGNRANADHTLDPGVGRQYALVAGGDELPRPQEACGVTGSEQLLGIGALAAGVLVLRALRGGAGCIVPSATDLLPDAGALTSAQARIEVLLRLLARRGG